MSTRANIIIKEGEEHLYFYRHSDGYPDGALPTLTKFINLVKDGKIRNNIGQSAGWLIFIGSIEYRESNPDIFTAKEPNDVSPNDWKIGAYEPTTGIHGDIEYLYVLDLNRKEVQGYKCSSKKGCYYLLDEKGRQLPGAAIKLPY